MCYGRWGSVASPGSHRCVQPGINAARGKCGANHCCRGPWCRKLGSPVTWRKKLNINAMTQQSIFHIQSMSGFTPSNIDIIRFPVRKRIWWWSWVVHLGMVTNPLPKSRDFGDGDRFGRVGLAGRWMGALWPSYLRIQKDPKGLFGQLNSLAKDLQGGYGDVQRQDWGLLQIQFATSHTPTCNSLGLFGLLSCKSWCFHQYSSTKYWIDTDMDCIILYIYIIYYIYMSYYSYSIWIVSYIQLWLQLWPQFV